MVVEVGGLTLIRVDPGVYEMKRYEVFRDKEAVGFVFQFMSQLDLASETSRIRIDGKRRPFWSFAGADGRPEYRVKLETRKDALRWLERSK